MPEKKRKQLQTSLARRIIRYIPTSKAEYQRKKIPFFLLLITTLIAGVIVFKVTYTAYQYLTNFEVKDLVNIFAEDLQKDDEGRTNILILGAGGGEHDGADLTDTIIIASLQEDKNTVSLVSVPRDLWLDIPGYGSSRINKMYETQKPKYGSDQALEILKTGVEQITDLDIPYYIKIDFKAFVSIVDLLGGVTVEVKESIHDELYPDEKQIGYETFAISAGIQHLDGKTALKYARSRHSTSDFDRAARQHQILKAIKEKAAESQLLDSPLQLKKLFEQLSENVSTNMDVTEMISLARFAKDFNSENLASAVLKDQDVIQAGSFLYTPERELYGGAFVLVPLENSYTNIQKFIEIVFDHPEFLQEKASVQILNGAGRTGLAAKIGESMIQFGFNVQRYGNADHKDYKTSHYYINNPTNTRVTNEVLQELYPQFLKARGKAPDTIDTEDYDITIILADDALVETE